MKFDNFLSITIPKLLFIIYYSMWYLTAQESFFSHDPNTDHWLWRHINSRISEVSIKYTERTFLLPGQKLFLPFSNIIFRPVLPTQCVLVLSSHHSLDIPVVASHLQIWQNIWHVCLSEYVLKIGFLQCSTMNCDTVQLKWMWTLRSFETF